MKNSNHRENGFTLIEIGMVLAIVAIIIGGVYAILYPWLVRGRYFATQQKMEVIADHLASFAIANNRLPCPSDPDETPGGGEPPFGYERDSGPNGTDTDTVCEGANAEGVVPFRTIGLNEDAARDGWGNYITYRISPVFAITDDSGNVSTDDYNTVHAICRFRSWIEWRGTSGTSDIYVSYNPDKARFCCPPAGSAGNVFHPSTDIVIEDVNGRPMWSGTRTDAAALYDLVNEKADVNMVDTLETPEAALIDTLAFVLVSHGPNGYGAFTGASSSARQADLDGSGSTLEDENRDGDNIFVSGDYSGQRDNTYFDDVLLWRTQSQIYSEFGDNSCLKP